MDAELMTTQNGTPRRQRGAEERIKQLISRHKAERDALMTQAEYMRRVAVMLIPLVPKQIVARILQDAKECSQPTKRRN